MDNIRTINKFGYKNIAIFVVLFLLSYFFGFFPYIFGLILLFVILIYRNPEAVPQIDDPKAILSPIDGTIIAVKKSIYKGNNYIEIIIKNTIFNSGVLRSPGNLDIGEILIKNGLNLYSSNTSKNLLSQRVAYICSPFIIRISSGVFSRKIYFEKLKQIKIGRRFGFIVDGRVSVFIPQSSRIKVSVGNKIKALNIIGFLED